MKELYNQILSKILEKHKDTLAVFSHGSSISEELKDYGDIDINVYISGEPKTVIENEIIKLDGKKILLNLNFENYRSALNSAKNEQNLEQLLILLVSFQRIKVIYDKNKILPKVIKEINKRKKEIRKKQIKRFPVQFNIMVDFFFKLKRSYNKKDILGVIYSARIIANNCARLVQFFNKSELEDFYNPVSSNYMAKNILKFKKVPKHFKEDYVICSGVKENLTTTKIYNSSARMMKEVIDFINIQKLKEIKNKEFFKLLNQAKEL